MRYRSKVDLWIAALASLAPIGLAVAAIATRDWRVAVGGAIYLGLISLIVVPCEYLLESAQIVVRSGLIKWRIPYGEISKVEPTHNPLSSPAWSLDRLRVTYGAKWIMISPAEKGRFLDDLAQRAHLRRYGDQLVREKTISKG